MCDGYSLLKYDLIYNYMKDRKKNVTVDVLRRLTEG